MADAKQCDRCKKLYSLERYEQMKRPSIQGHNVNVLRFYALNGLLLKSIDLCPECSKEVMVFLNLVETDDEKEEE